MDEISNKYSKGFTLLETLVALSVLAISLGVTYQVFSSALHGSTLADDYAQASMYADSHLAEIGSTVHTLPTISEGVYNQRYRWKLEVQAMDSSTSKTVIEDVKRFQVILSVYWESKNGQRSIRTMTFRLANA